MRHRFSVGCTSTSCSDRWFVSRPTDFSSPQQLVPFTSHGFRQNWVTFHSGKRHGLQSSATNSQRLHGRPYAARMAARATEIIRYDCSQIEPASGYTAWRHRGSGRDDSGPKHFGMLIIFRSTERWVSSVSRIRLATAWSAYTAQNSRASSGTSLGMRRLTDVSTNSRACAERPAGTTLFRRVQVLKTVRMTQYSTRHRHIAS